MPIAIEEEFPLPATISDHALISGPATSGRFYRPELDIVRLLAFLLVFMHHTFSVPGTASMPKAVANVLNTLASTSIFGLSLFFTLSAYLICELLSRERELTGSVQIRRFYIRRILRIWPLYFAGLTIALVVAVVLRETAVVFPWVALSAILLGNWYVAFHAFPISPMTPLWSISVEEQFYVFAPMAIRSLSRRLLYILCAALFIIANGCILYLQNIHAPFSSVWTNSFIQFENFAAGMLLCLILRGRLPNLSVLTRVLLAGVAFLCWYLAVGWSNFQFITTVPSAWQLVRGWGLGALGCVFLLVSFLGIRKEVLPSWGIYLGRISFGLYVFHHLAIDFSATIFHHPQVGSRTMVFKAVVALGLTLALASLSYRFLELPFLRVKKRFEIIKNRPDTL